MSHGTGGFIERLAKHAHSYAHKSGSQARRAMGEWAIWRRKIIGERREEANNGMGADMEGTTFKTKDHPIQVQDNGTDHNGMQNFFVSAPCTQGDLIITKKGQPDTPEDARAAPKAYVYCVKGYNHKRDPEGKLIYSRVEVEPDRSGQW